MPVTPSQALIDACMARLDSVDGIGAAVGGTPPKVKLFVNNITPTKGNVVADFTLATFTGSAPKLYEDDSNGVPFVDPVSGVLYINSPEPASPGWNFICTTAPASPETIYGFIVTDNAGTVLYGAQRFDSPVIVTSIGDAVDIQSIQWAWPPTFTRVS